MCPPLRGLRQHSIVKPNTIDHKGLLPPFLAKSDYTVPYLHRSAVLYISVYKPAVAYPFLLTVGIAGIAAQIRQTVLAGNIPSQIGGNGGSTGYIQVIACVPKSDGAVQSHLIVQQVQIQKFQFSSGCKFRHTSMAGCIPGSYGGQLHQQQLCAVFPAKLQIRSAVFRFSARICSRSPVSAI